MTVMSFGDAMSVHRFSAEEVRSLGPAEVAARVRALIPGVQSVGAQVREIVEAIETGGDAALRQLTSSLDLEGASPPPLLVGQDELDEAIKSMPREVIAGLQVAIANVSEVAQAVGGGEAESQLPQGHSVSVRELPVDSAAVYVPGGRAPYPSTAVMGVVTARAAGVLDVCVCSPPRGADGDIDPLILGACRLLGVQRVYRMGGAQAIAALAIGTKTVPRVDVIVGPGNLYVQEAKRQLCDRVGIDGIAGPSDLVVVFGPDADTELVALDLLAQAEHGAGSLVVAISHSQQALAALEAELSRLRAELTDGARQTVCAIIACEDAAGALALADAIAPEHLELIGEGPEQLAHAVRHAGCLFVGAGTATAFGDYVAGSNHILPTAGGARFASMLNVGCFRRRMAEVRIDADSARKLAAAGAPIARAEGFELHARSMEARAAAATSGSTALDPPPAKDTPIGENPGT